jgi:RNA polymerase sigma-70 factor (ECF subfamily)
MAGRRRSNGVTPLLAPSDVDIYRLFSLELTHYAASLVGPDDAADVVSDAVMSAFASPKWPVENPRAYLYRAVYNRVIDVQRSAARRRGRDTAWPARSTAETHSSIDAVRALSVLTAQQRAVVYLSYWEDLTVAAVAELLEVGEGTVRKQLARARERLRKVLS